MENKMLLLGKINCRNLWKIDYHLHKADVIFTPPVANTTNPSEVGEPENKGEEQAAFADLVERVE